MSSTIQVVYDGPLHSTVQITGINEGGRDVALDRVIESAVLEGSPKRLCIEGVEYNVSGGIVKLYFDAFDPVEFLALAGDGYFCYRLNPLTQSKDLSTTGDILLSTVGFDAGSSYSIKLDLKKKF